MIVGLSPVVAPRSESSLCATYVRVQGETEWEAQANQGRGSKELRESVWMRARAEVGIGDQREGGKRENEDEDEGKGARTRVRRCEGARVRGAKPRPRRRDRI